MNPLTANESNEPDEKRQKTSNDSASNEISSITKAIADKQVAGLSNVHQITSNSRVENATVAVILDTDTSNGDANETVDDTNINDPNAGREKPHSSNQPNANRQRKSSERNEENIEIAAAVAPIVQQTAAILKLDIDCFEEAFDYLRLQELIHVGKTCKRLQQVAGYCFQQNYGNHEHLEHLEIICTHFAYFIPFIRVILIYGRNALEYFLQSHSKFHRLKQIKFRVVDFTEIEIGRLITMVIWKKLVVLSFYSCTFSRNFQEILNLCSKLKRLEIDYCRGEFDLFDRKYPTLEYFKFVSRDDTTEEFPMFLKLNPNIRKFATSADCFWKNQNKTLKANIKLDDLAIEFGNYSEWKSICDLLNELHKRGFYRKLQLYIWELSQEEMINQIAAVNGLNKLRVQSSKNPISLSPFKNLEEIYVHDSDFIADLSILPNNLANLKRIHFHKASFDTIMQFIRWSVEMQRIKVDILSAGVHLNRQTKVIDLRALNREREQLPDAAKITLYIGEEIYLATKWAFGETDLEFIRLKRKESIEWHHDFWT